MAARPRRILVLCHGNICRSPFAEAALRSALALREASGFEVRSAGFVLPGRHPPSEASSVAAERGLDLSRHISGLVTPWLLEWADLTLVMSAEQRRRLRAAGRGARVELLGDFDPRPIERRAILDPVERPREVFVAVYDRIERCCEALADALSAGSAESGPSE